MRKQGEVIEAFVFFVESRTIFFASSMSLSTQDRIILHAVNTD